MTHDPIPDPGWNAELRARGLFGRRDPDRVPLPPLSLIMQWRFMWIYLLGPAEVFGLIMILGLITYYGVHPADPPLGLLWVTGAIGFVTFVAAFFIGRHSPRWPDRNDQRLVLAAYRKALERGFYGGMIALFFAQAITVFAAVSSLPFVWIATNVLWLLLAVAIVPTRARVQRHIGEAAARGLDLRAALFLPAPPD